MSDQGKEETIKREVDWQAMSQQDAVLESAWARLADEYERAGSPPDLLASMRELESCLRNTNEVIVELSE